jgi:hypothetical protein
VSERDGVLLVFPIRDLNEHPGPLGMTLRDYFATHAPDHRNEIPALFVEAFADRVTGYTGRGGRRPLTAPEMADCFAEWRYTLADAMIKARGE